MNHIIIDVFAAMRKPEKIATIISVSVLGLSLAALASTKWLTWTVNLTNSLPGKIYVIHKGSSLMKGDTVAFHFRGGATYPAGTTFIKIVMGIEGDTVRVKGKDFWVNDVYIGAAKPKSRAGIPLEAAKGGVIPPGEYFMATPNPNSLDSRYSMTGNIRQDEIIGRAYRVF